MAGSNLNISGSSVVADHAVNLVAGKDVTIAAATDTANESHERSVKESGFLSAGGFGISYGQRTSCPAASCINGDPIANAIPDPGTNAYNEAVARKAEKDVNIATTLFSVGGAAVRGVMAMTELATTTGGVARALEVVRAANAASEVAGKIPGTAIKAYWPPNGGFGTAPMAEELGAGYQFSRYGGFFDESGAFKDFGTFIAPADVPYGMRALPPGTNLKPLSTYEVIKPIPDVPSGPAAPYFGELGLGKQHQLPLTI